MCGIAGILALPGHEHPTVPTLSRMNDTIAHRGPDDDGIYVDGPVGLAFRRLAILDLSAAGHQPMVSNDGAHVLIFNGEIFNFVELREELTALGHRFTSSGDSAVLMAAYRQWGVQCVEKFVGMFAFCMYDRQKHTIFLARDRFGVKPLFLLRTQRGVVFGSELKAVRASGYWSGRLNDARFASLLVHQRTDLLPESNDSFLDGVVQLQPAHTLEIAFDGAETLRRYWSLPDRTGDTPRDPVGEFGRLFDDAMRLRMRADVAVGVMLSGGMDSSSIACEMARLVGAPASRPAPLHAFCYESEDFDESVQLADTVAQTGVVVHRYNPDPQAVWAEFARAIWHHDEPIHSASVLMGFGLYRLAAQHGVRVVLGGQGADETIGGYGYLFENMLVSHALAGRVGALWSEAGALAADGALSRQSLLTRTFRRVRAHLMMSSAAYRKAATARRMAEAPGWQYVRSNFGALAGPAANAVGGQDLHSALIAATTDSPLPCYLRAEDRNSSAHSVEARVPFLDHRLAEFCVALPPAWQMRDGWNKYVLREAMRGRIPDSVRTRRVKFGFPTSVRKWFAGPLSASARTLILDGPLAATGWMDMAKVEAALDKHVRGEGDYSNVLFNASQLSHWLRLHADGWQRPS
jgi:asparagine synthase (glutamine-hydrolysing)